MRPGPSWPQLLVARLALDVRAEAGLAVRRLRRWVDESLSGLLPSRLVRQDSRIERRPR